MAAKIHGRLGAQDLSATTNTSIYSVPASRKATVNVSIANRNSTATTVRLMHLAGAIGTLSNVDYIAYDVQVPGNGYIERTAICMAASATIGGYAGATGVTMQVQGVEEDA